MIPEGVCWICYGLLPERGKICSDLCSKHYKQEKKS
jgi:predicted nucleic acid-binding Zn ribbon protein